MIRWMDFEMAYIFLPTPKYLSLIYVSCYKADNLIAFSIDKAQKH